MFSPKPTGDRWKYSARRRRRSAASRKDEMIAVASQQHDSCWPIILRCSHVSLARAAADVIFAFPSRRARARSQLLLSAISLVVASQPVGAQEGSLNGRTAVSASPSSRFRRSLMWARRPPAASRAAKHPQRPVGQRAPLVGGQVQVGAASVGNDE